MRFLRFAVVAALVVSLIGNVVLYNRTERRRAQLTINGKVITKKDYHDWLESHSGLQAMAFMTQYNLVMQAAEKIGASPKKDEIDQLIQDAQERTPGIAAQMRYQPWVEVELRQKAEMERALIALSTKDVKATDDEVRDYFNRNPGRWDQPDKIYLKAVQCADKATAEKAKDLMSRVNDMSIVAQQLAGKAAVVGSDGTWVITKPVGRPSPDPGIESLSKKSKGSTETVQVRNGKGGISLLAVKFVDVKLGKVLSFEEAKPKVVEAFKLDRRTPVQEVMRKLWDQSDITTDPPDLKPRLELVLFPGQAQQQASR